MKVKLSGIRKIAVRGEFIKLDSLLKHASVVQTGGEAKLLIASGDVFLNGETCLMRGKKIRPGDTVRCQSETLVITGDGNVP